MKPLIELPEPDNEIDITPMIDCVFLLVLFFMVTSSFIDEAKAFKITLPQAEEAETYKVDDMEIVEIALDGKVALSGSTGSHHFDNAAGLVEPLSARTGQTKDRPVLIRADRRCEYEQVVKVKNALKRAGVTTIFEAVAEK